VADCTGTPPCYAPIPGDWRPPVLRPSLAKAPDTSPDGPLLRCDPKRGRRIATFSLPRPNPPCALDCGSTLCRDYPATEDPLSYPFANLWAEPNASSRAREDAPASLIGDGARVPPLRASPIELLRLEGLYGLLTIRGGNPCSDPLSPSSAFHPPWWPPTALPSSSTTSPSTLPSI